MAVDARQLPHYTMAAFVRLGRLYPGVRLAEVSVLCASSEKNTFVGLYFRGQTGLMIIKDDYARGLIASEERRAVFVTRLIEQWREFPKPGLPAVLCDRD